jgi:hypothetical protein
VFVIVPGSAENTVLGEEAREMRGFARAMLVTSVLVVLYPLSAGPAAWLLIDGGIPGVGPNVPAFNAVYHPLARLPEPQFSMWTDYVQRWM